LTFNAAWNKKVPANRRWMKFENLHSSPNFEKRRTLWGHCGVGGEEMGSSNRKEIVCR
jgi:hypothetical protein